MPGDQELVKPIIRKAPQMSVRQSVDKFIAKVEQPEGLEAQRTFGRHQTEAEIRAQRVRRMALEIGLWVVALLIIVIIVSVNWGSIKGFLDWALDDKEPEVVAIPEATPIPSNIETSLFSGLAYQLGEDLGWIRSELFSDLTYYYAGEVTRGEYVGAKRYFAVGLLVSDSTLATYEFWQLPDGQILLNGEKQNPRRWLTILNDYYVRLFFAENVTMIDQLQGDWPQTLPVSPSMIMYRREVLTDLGPYDGVYRGAPRLALALPSEYYQQLPLLEAQNYVDLKFYTKMYSGDELFSQIAPNLAYTDEWIADRYLFGGTKIIVTDRTGVSYVYELVFKDTWANYQQTRDNDLRYLEYYQQELIKYTATASFASYRQRALAGQVLALPDGQPRMPVIDQGLPGINFQASDFELTSGETYETYTSAYTAVCYPHIDAKIVQGITEDDVVQVGRLFESQLPVYVLRDREHVLAQMAYRLKFANSTLDWQEVAARHIEKFIEMKELDEFRAMEARRGELELEMPTLTEYTDSRPLLLIPDPWGRYMLVWENDLDFLADCGII